MTQIKNRASSLYGLISSANIRSYLRLIIIGGFSLCVLLFNACSTAAPAKSSSPVWPNNGVAQRDFYGSKMFIERDNKKWFAWVLSDADKDADKALDFFSGNSQRVTLKYYEDGYLADEFTDRKGRKHKMAKDAAHLHFDDPRPGGFVGTVGFSDQRLYLGKKGAYCSPQLMVVTGMDPNKKNPWRKIPLYRDKAAKDCPGGRWMSLIGTSLDLGDGTFLASTEFNVFRLRMSDLSPVGAAPALHVVDAEKIESIIKAVEGKTIDDPNAYLTSQLNLQTLAVSPSGQKTP